MKLDEITFQTFKDRLEVYFKNTEELRKHEDWCSLPRKTSYPYAYIISSIDRGELNASNFKDSWQAKHFVDEWNRSICGDKYDYHKKHYAKVIADPNKIKVLDDIKTKTIGWWGYHNRRFQEQMDNDGKPSFYIFYTLYYNTKSTFRHWWDTYNNDHVFKSGDMVEVRSTATRNHIMKCVTYEGGHTSLRSVGYTTAQSLKGTLLMVLGYEQVSPPQTYSYKKGKGGTKMVTLLPIGSTQKIYLAEQFLKVSRKKAVKEAKGKKKK